MSHQDWDPVVIRKTKTGTAAQRAGQTTSRTKYNAGKNSNTYQPQNARKIAEEEQTSAPATVTHELKMKIQQARMAKGWTQKKLAQMTNIQHKIIQSYENGKAIPNPKDLGVIGRALGVQLSNKKRKGSKKGSK